MTWNNRKNEGVFMKSYAIDLGGTAIKLAVLVNGEILADCKLDSESGKGLSRKLPIISETLINLDKEWDSVPAKGIGIAFAGIVNGKEKKIITSNEKFMDAPQIDLVRWCLESFNLPVKIENDANAALLGELYYGVAKGKTDAALMILGTGVGTAAVMDGELVRGKHFQAGCLGGHFSVDLSGKCNCGNVGCLEANASTWALPFIINREKEYLDSPLRHEKVQDFRILRTYYLRQDPLACKITKKCIAYWGAGIVNMIHAYDPECVVLSGGVLRFTEIIDPIKQWVWDHAWTPWGRVEILCADNPQKSVLLGLHHLVEEL